MRRQSITRLNIAVFVLWLLQVYGCASTAVLPDAPVGKAWEPIPELSDEFEGEKLDSAKWHDHNPVWEGRKPAFFSRENVSVSGGKLHLTARVENREDLPEGFHTFTTAAVKSKVPVRYGYFEVKARPMKAKVSSGFWFYNKTDDEWTEIDVFEICGAGPECTHTLHMHVHVFHTATQKNHWLTGGSWKSPFDLTADYHVYGLEWDEAFIRWYVDGKLVREMENTHWHQPLYMNFDAETQPEWFGLPSKEDLPATFSVEYVRAWRKESK